MRWTAHKLLFQGKQLNLFEHILGATVLKALPARHVALLVHTKRVHLSNLGVSFALEQFLVDGNLYNDRLFEVLDDVLSNVEGFHCGKGLRSAYNADLNNSAQEFELHFFSRVVLVVLEFLATFRRVHGCHKHVLTGQNLFVVRKSYVDVAVLVLLLCKPRSYYGEL